MVRPELTPDVLLVGGGPAGLALAAELASTGRSVTVVEQNLDRPWQRSFGAWATALPGGVVDDAVIGRFPKPRVTFALGHCAHIAAEYVRFDTGRLQSTLRQRATRRGVHFLHARFCGAQAGRAGHSARLAEEGGGTTLLRAAAIVDCSGRAFADGDGARRPVAYQSAFGAWLEVGEIPFAPGEMCLMDLRAAPGSHDDGLAQPSFLYSLPEGPGLLFAQETVLASRRAASMRILEGRLLRRLDALGVTVRRRIAVERCVIPLGAPLPPAHGNLLAFGAAAGMIQPASGYSLAHALSRAPVVADALSSSLDAGSAALADAGWRAVWPDDARRAWTLHRLGLHTLLSLKEDEMAAFWRAFFELAPGTVAGFLDGQLSAQGVARAMWRVFVHLPTRQRLHFLREGTRFALQGAA